MLALLAASSGCADDACAHLAPTGALAQQASLPAVEVGRLRALAAARSTVAVLLEDGTTRIYVLDAGVPRPTATVAGIRALQIALAEDGRLLFVRGTDTRVVDTNHSAVHVFALGADGTLLEKLPFPALTDAPYVGFAISADGAVLARWGCARMSGSVTSCRTSVFRDRHFAYGTAGGTQEGALLSPGGARLAIPGAPHGGEPVRWTDLYEDGALEARLEGVTPRLWLDDARLLVQTRSEQTDMIIDVTGARSAVRDGPLRGPLGLAGPGRFHAGARIYRSSDGKLLWDLLRDAGQTATGAAAVAGDYLVFVQDSALRTVEIALRDADAP